MVRFLCLDQLHRLYDVSHGKNCLDKSLSLYVFPTWCTKINGIFELILEHLGQIEYYKVMKRYEKFRMFFIFFIKH